VNIDDVERSCYLKTHVFDEFVEDVEYQFIHIRPNSWPALYRKADDIA